MEFGYPTFMQRRMTITALALALATAGLTAPTTYAAVPAKEGRARQHWTEADKAGFGTARESQSRVWFTLQGGRVSEVFYPDLSTPSVRNLELIVSDGVHDDRQSKDMTTVVTRPDERSLRFTQVSTDNDGHYRVTEEVVTDPATNAVVVHIAFESLDGASHALKVRHEPALGNGAEGDRTQSSKHALKAVDRTAHVATTVLTSPGLTATKDRAGIQTGTIQPITSQPFTATLSLGFGRTSSGSAKAARTALAQPWATTAAAYDAGWHGYLDTLKPVPASASAVQRQYLASALVLAAGEDKAHPGAFVASPSMPWVWGDEVKDLSSPSASYHEVWARDLYQIGTALYAMGDVAAARRAVKWLFRTQQKKDGSFPQNSDGTAPRSGPRSSSTRSHCRSRWRTWWARPTSAPTRGSRRPCASS